MGVENEANRYEKDSLLKWEGSFFMRRVSSSQQVLSSFVPQSEKVRMGRQKQNRDVFLIFTV